MGLVVGGIYIEITSKCNLHCSYCYHGDCLNQTISELTMEKFESLLEQLSFLGISEIEFSGGEPTLHKNLIEMADMAKKRSFSLKLITNGIELYKIDSESLHLFDEIAISLDGITAEEHNAVRGVNSFECLSRSLCKLQEFKLMDKVSFTVTVSKRNYQNIEQMIQYAIQCGAAGINFNNLHGTPNNDNSSFQDELLLGIEIRKINETIKELKDKYGSNVEIVPLRNVGGDCPLLHDNENIRLRIDYKGSVFLCEGFCGDDFSIGNIYKKSLGDIIKGKECEDIIGFIRNRINLVKECQSCLLKDVYCKGGCVADAYFKQKDCLCPDSGCELRKRDMNRQLFKQLMNKKIVIK